MICTMKVTTSETSLFESSCLREKYLKYLFLFFVPFASFAVKNVGGFCNLIHFLYPNSLKALSTTMMLLPSCRITAPLNCKRPKTEVTSSTPITPSAMARF